MIKFKAFDSLGRGYAFRYGNDSFNYFTYDNKVDFRKTVVFFYNSEFSNKYEIDRFESVIYKVRNFAQVLHYNKNGDVLFSISGSREDLSVSSYNGSSPFDDEIPSDYHYMFSGRSVDFVGTSYNDHINLDLTRKSIINGMGGNDTLVGGANSRIFGGAGDDSLSYGKFQYGGAGDDTLKGFTNSSTYGGEGDDTILGENALLVGGAGNDTLLSKYGSTLFGGAGDDSLKVIHHSYDTATLVDGSGIDTFILNASDASAEVKDFSKRDDVIRVLLERDNLSDLRIQHHEGNTIFDFGLNQMTIMGKIISISDIDIIFI